jgi:hypothetical protein
MEKILIALKQEMIANKKNSQPADGDMYWAQTNHWVGEFEIWMPYLFCKASWLALVEVIAKSLSENFMSEKRNLN